MDALSGRDKALTTRLALGVVATSGTLDQVINAHLRPGTKLEPQVRDVLRLCSYEILHLTTPIPAFVNDGVELTRAVRPRVTGLTNAVLHRVAEEDLPRLNEARARVQAGGTDPTDLAFVGGLPQWIVDELVRSRGLAFTRDLALSLEEPAPVYVAGNYLKHPAGQSEALLVGTGLDPKPAGVRGSFVLGSPAGLAGSRLVQNVDVIPSDLSSQVVAILTTPATDAQLLEVGQGRGTKTLLMQSAAHYRGVQIDTCSIDLERFKVQLAVKRVKKAGFGDRCRSLVFDACELDGRRLPREVMGRFDTVFVDAPCSGVGTLRRHPEIAWSLDPALVDADHPKSLPAIQLCMLRAAASRVGEGGTLVYSTCSPLVQEDEDIVAAFLQSDAGRGFSPVNVGKLAEERGIHGEALEWIRSSVLPDGSCCFGQRLGGPDAHYCAVLRRS